MTYFPFTPIRRWRWLVLTGLAAATLLIATNNSIQPSPPNLVSVSSSSQTWEPSSAAGTTWLTSFEDLTHLYGLTSYWQGMAGWSIAYRHTSPVGNPAGDLFALNNPSQQKNHLVMIDLSNLNLLFQTSTDNAGSNWNPAQIAYPGLADYPSVAVMSGGTTIVAGINMVGMIGGSNVVTGYQTMVSTNGGQSWTGPHVVTSSGFQGFGRVVWSAKSNAFHILFVDKSNPTTYYLKRAQSSDGVNWSISSPIDTFTAPAPISPTAIVNGNHIFYATNNDAAASGALGWVVVYPAARSDNPNINNVKFCAETLGCTTISYPNDLFIAGITTSSSGDLWLNMFTYSSPSSRTVPLKQLAVYREANGSYLSAFVSPSQGIDPTSLGRVWG